MPRLGSLLLLALALVGGPSLSAAAAQVTDPFDATMQRGVDALNAGDAESAVRAFREALDLQPDHPGAQTMLGSTLLDLGQTAEARDLLEQAARALPDHYPARIGLARAYLALGRTEDAVRELEAAVGLQPSDTASRARLATLLFRAGRLEAAVEHARSLHEQLPQAAGAATLLGVIELARGADDRALAAFDAALALRPEDPDARYGRAAALRGLDREAEAVEVLDRLVGEHPQRADAWTLLGDVFAGADDIESKLTAVGMYRTALDLRPDDTRVLGSLFSLFEAAGLDDEALALLEGAEATRSSPGLLLQLGALQFELERLDAARATYERATTIGGGAEAWYRLGVVQVNLADLEAAEVTFRRAMEVDPELTAAARELGKVLLDRGRAAEAETVMAGVIGDLPDDPSSWYLAGLAASRAGAPETAIERFERARALDPANADVVYNLGLALRQAERVDESRVALAEAQRMRAETAGADAAPRSDEERGLTALRAGYLRYRVGSLEAAVELLERATELVPDIEGGWFHLGLARAALGQAPAAITALERATRLNPDRAETWEILARMYDAEGRAADAQRARETLARLQDGP